MLTITYVYNSRQIDVDNLPKPIVDALKGLVFEDDQQITDMVSRKRRFMDGLSVGRPSISLEEVVGSGNDSVHVLVTEAPNQRIID